MRATKKTPKRHVGAQFVFLNDVDSIMATISVAIESEKESLRPAWWTNIWSTVTDCRELLDPWTRLLVRLGQS